MPLPPDFSPEEKDDSKTSAISPGRKQLCSWIATICGAVLVWAAIYAPVRHFDFLNFDDDMFLSDNPWLTRGLTWQSVQWAFCANLTLFSNHAEYWSPITLLSRLADAEIFGMAPGAFHVTSAAIHLLNAALLWFALFRLTGARWRAAVVAALFLVHPLNVEPVCWLSARKDLLGATFFFVTLIAYASFARKPNLGRYLLVIASVFAALMSKPMAVTLPLLLLFLDWWPLDRWNDPTRTRSVRLLFEKLPIALIAAAGAWLAVASQKFWGAIRTQDEFSLSVRVINALVSYTTYLRRIVWPSDLAIYYPHPGHSLTFAAGLAAFLFLSLVSAAAILLARRTPFFLAGWLWFGVVLGPVIGLVQIGNQGMADRYAYPSVIGIFIALVWGAEAWLRKHPRLAATGAVAAVSLLAIISARQVLTWRNSETVFRQALAVTSNNELAHLNLGNVYFLRKDYLAAQEEYHRSLAVRPGQFLVWNNLGVVATKLGNEEEAINDYRKALAINPTEKKSRISLARLLASRNEFAEAEFLLRVAVGAEPDWREPYAELDKIYSAQGRWSTAAALWSGYLLLHPTDPVAIKALDAIHAHEK